MAREAHPQRPAALKAIVEHEAALGPIEGARAAKKLFPDVGVPTWKSWVKLARVAAVVEPAESFAVASRTVTPITPAVESHGLEFDQRIAEMDMAARALIDVAWPIDETGRRGRVKNPMLLKAAHAALAQTAGLVVKNQQAAWNAEVMADLYQTVVDTVVEVAKRTGNNEFGIEIMNAMEALQQKRKNPRKATLEEVWE
jgi:hypothetical protein